MALYFNGMIRNKVSFLFIAARHFREKDAVVIDRSAAERRNYVST